MGTASELVEWVLEIFPTSMGSRKGAVVGLINGLRIMGVPLHDFNSFKHGNPIRKISSVGLSNSYSDQTIKSVFISVLKRIYNE